ncbi:MAG: MFS transporter, partial [Chloroflexota bacterium]|nr:MFS transporter [Chloroflexota bacterium]MDE2682756.1 MFS transporter [Chloroflexota bacterium]
MVIAAAPVFDAGAVGTVAFQVHFGWSAAQLALAFLFARVGGRLAGPLEGYLTDRIGTRRTVLFGLAVLGGSWMLFSIIENLWMLYLCYVLFTFGAGLAGWIPLTTMLFKWFVRRRGLALGCFQVIEGLGGVVLLPVIAWCVGVDAPGGMGWSMTALIIGAGILVLTWPLTRLLHNDPRDYGMEPYGGRPPHPNLTAREALRTRAFWLISLGNCFIAMIIVGITTHLPLLMADEGFALEHRGLVFSINAGVATLFYLVGGLVGDRISKRVALTLFATLQAAGVFALLIAQNLPMFYLFALLFGAGMGGVPRQLDLPDCRRLVLPVH